MKSLPCEAYLPNRLYISPGLGIEVIGEIPFSLNRTPDLQL